MNTVGQDLPAGRARPLPLRRAAKGACAAVLLLAAAAAWSAPIDAARSRLSASFKQMNVPVEGTFTRISGDIVLDPARPQDAKASLEIDLASFDLGPGTEDYSVEVRRKDWFDTAKFPRATFILSSARAIGPCATAAHTA